MRWIVWYNGEWEVWKVKRYFFSMMFLTTVFIGCGSSKDIIKNEVQDSVWFHSAYYEDNFTQPATISPSTEKPTRAAPVAQQQNLLGTPPVMGVRDSISEESVRLKDNETFPEGLAFTVPTEGRRLMESTELSAENLLDGMGSKEYVDTTQNYETDVNFLKLSEYTTEFKNAAKSRSHNIQQASIAIDQKIVQPDAVFSFNDAVGPTTRQNGYMLGRIFVNGKDSKGYGGGVCQVSSTLYNAVELAGMEVVEQHHHSKPVYYVPEGKDATTSYGVIDFKFKNNKPYPIRINSYLNLEQENVTVAIEECV